MMNIFTASPDKLLSALQIRQLWAVPNHLVLAWGPNEIGGRRLSKLFPVRACIRLSSEAFGCCVGCLVCIPIRQADLDSNNFDRIFINTIPTSNFIFFRGGRVGIFVQGRKPWPMRLPTMIEWSRRFLCWAYALNFSSASWLLLCWFNRGKYFAFMA